MKVLKLRSRRENRRANRVRLRWDASYRRDSHGPWLPCHVIDLSVDGAALELPENVSPPSSRLLLLDLQCGDEPSGDVVLRVEVRSLSVSSTGRQRIGVMFVNLNSLERQFLADKIKHTADMANVTRSHR